jgi:hypothetical protein
MGVVDTFGQGKEMNEPLVVFWLNYAPLSFQINCSDYISTSYIKLNSEFLTVMFKGIFFFALAAVVS